MQFLVSGFFSLFFRLIFLSTMEHSRIGGIIAGGCIFLGQIVWAGGSHLTPNGIAFYLAMLGRGITGLGGPALIVIRSGYLSKWFRSKELSLAFAVAMSGTRIVSIHLHPFIVILIFSSGKFRCVLCYSLGR